MLDKKILIRGLSEDLIVDLTAQLVAIPTRNPPGEEKAGAEFILSTLRSWGIETELIREPDPDRPQVAAWVEGTGQGPTFVLNGHIDTVQEGDAATWRVPPFAATREGDRLYGLGACDMKGALAMAMAILKLVHDAPQTLPGTLMFHAAMGEEQAEDGTRTLLKMGYGGDAAIVMEPTDLRVGLATRGVGWFQIILTGNPVHCGLADPDAPDMMAQFARIQAALSTYHARVSQQSHPLLRSPSCRVSQVQVGERHNHLPARGEFTIDRRMLPHENFAQVEQELDAILKAVRADDPSLAYELTYMRGNEPVEVAEDQPLVTTLCDNLRTWAKVEPVFAGMNAGTDVRNFVFDQGIPAVNFGAGDFTVCHQPNEFVTVDGLMAAARVLMATALDYVAREHTA